jgi:hypothetical protein
MFKVKLLCLSLILLLATRVGAAEQIWQPVIQAQARVATATPTERQYQVDSQALRALLQRVSAIGGPGAQRIINLPMPDGSLADFEIYESPVMAEELAQRYPEIKTYKVYGIDDPMASGRLTITPQGFHAMLHTSQGRLFIDPHQDKQLFDRYQARTQQSAAGTGYSCGVDDFTMPAVAENQSMLRPAAARIAGSFLSYKLAVSATKEYVDRVYNPLNVVQTPVQQALSAIVTAINRVNVIYQRDLGIQLMLVSGEELIEKPGDDIFSNGDLSRMLIQNQAWIDSTLGRSKYHIGHVFGTDGGGLASLGSACDRDDKAKGASGISNPQGVIFWIDFVAHEIGHQLNADHSFNGTDGSCSSGRNQATAFEPGSGSTIMAYAGICWVEDLQNSSDATFHAASIAQINGFTKGEGSCYTRISAIPANPNDPLVSAIANRTIPADTAFVLTGFASDADRSPLGDPDPLSYQWDQLDAGCPTNARSFGTDTGFNGLFRSYLPRDNAARHFPAMGTQLDGLYDDAEVLPCNNRDINFRFTARDGRSGQDTADMRVTVQDTGAAFEILNLNDGATIDNPASFDVNWRIAGTTEAPISCDSVNIELLSFNATFTRYSVIPLQATFNDGIATDVKVVPDVDTHEFARIRVACSNNVFYDISDVTFRVNGTGAGIFSDFRRDVFYNNNGTTGGIAPVCGAIAKCFVAEDSNGGGGGGSGGGAFDYRWLVLLAVLLLLVRARRGVPVRGVV